MPFDQYTTPGEQKRREQKNLQTAQQAGAVGAPAGSSQYNQAYAQATAVDTGARGTLPTSTVMYLSGLGKDERDLAKLGSLFARNFATPPWYVFGTHDPKQYVSPVTGEHLSVKEARVFSNNFGAVPLASMLQSGLTYSTVTPGTTPGGLVQRGNVQATTLDPKKVGGYARAIADNLPDMGMQDALGASIHAAKAGYKPAAYANNLAMAVQWYATGGGESDPKQILAIADFASSKGMKLKSIADVGAIAYGQGNVELGRGIQQATQQAYQPQVDQYGNPIVAKDTNEVPGVVGIYSQEQRDKNIRDAAIRAGQPVPLARGETMTPDNVDNYWQQVQDEAKAVQMYDEASQNSFFYKHVMVPVGAAMNAFNVAYNDAFGGAVYVMRYPLAAVTAAASAIPGVDPQGDSPGANWNQVMNAGRYQASRLFGQQETPGGLMAEPLGDKYKHWVGPGLDLMIQWALDPGVLAGENRAAYLKKFVLPAELDHTNALKTALDWAGTKIPDPLHIVGDVTDTERSAVSLWADRVQAFAQSKISRRIFNAAGDDTKANRIIYRLRGKVEARGTLDMQYMTALRDKILEKYPNLGEDAWKEWQDGVKAHFLGVAPEGSVASDVVNARLTEGFRTDKIVADSKPATASTWHGHGYQDKNGLLVPMSEPQAMVNDAMGLHESAFPGWLRTEVPGTTPLSEWGPRRIVRSLVTSPTLTEEGIAGHGANFFKRLSALPNMNPGRMLEFHNQPEVYAYEHAVRWGTVSETQARELSSKVAEIVNSGRMTETRIQQEIDVFNSNQVSRILSQYNMSDEERAKLTADLLEPPASVKPLTEQAFGVVDGEGIYKPITEAQLQNQMYVPDPIVVRQGIRDYISTRDRMWNTLSKALGKDAPEIGTKALTNIGHAQIVKGTNIMGDIYRAWLRAWKAAAVARPGYVSRVVLGDENARFLATTSSVGDRLLSTAFGHRAAEDPNFVKGFLDRVFGTTVQVGDTTVDVRRAGAFEYAAEASGKVREADIVNELERGKKFLAPVMKADGSWAVIPPTDPTHMNSWTYGLTHHIRGTEPGDVALASVAAGDSVETTAIKLGQWAKDDKYYTAIGRIGVKPGDIGEWSDQLSKVVHGYTMDDAQVARVVMEGDRNKIAQILQSKYTPDQFPDVHGPTMAKLTEGGADPALLNRFMNWNYDTWLRRPEDALNRQPFYAEWKKRSQVAMYKAMNAQGIELTPKLRTVVDRASGDFALGQVNRVMFDFTKQSRFTELLQFAFPFPQPFFEGFQAWGHIAYRNPTSIAHARILFNAGVQSGFFKKDPISGEYMVSAGVMRWPAIWTASLLAGGDSSLMKHMDSPWLPLSNLNLLTASSIKFGDSGPIGALVGGLPIPVPSLNPLMAAGLMKAFANTRSPVLQGYLFQYGQNPNMLPTTLQAAAKTLFPSWYKDDASKASMSLAVTEAIHRYGLDKDEQGRPLPLNDAEIPAWEARNGTKFTGQTVEQIAADQTNAMFEMRPWVSMLMPTAARLAFEGQRSDYAAWETMLHDHNDDYQSAYAQWLKENPDKFMIPAGKTWTGPGEGDSTAVRVPASELTYQMLRTPGVGDFMRTYKPWAALLLVGTDPKLQDTQNFAAFSDLMSKGFVSYKTPAEYYQSGADNAGWSKVDTFLTHNYYPAFDKGVKGAGSETVYEQSDDYNKLKQERQKFFDGLYRTDPHWVLSHLKPQYAPDGKMVWDWPQDFTVSVPTQVARAHAHDIINMPELAQFPGVQALKGYMDGTEEIIQKMQDKRITDITSDKAREAGLWQQYQKVTQTALDQQPDIAPFLTKYFGVKIDETTSPATGEGRGGVTTTSKIVSTDDLVYNMSERAWAFQSVLDNLEKKGMTPQASQQVLDNVVQLDTHLTKLKHEASTGPINPYQRSLDYQKVNDLINTTYKQAPQVMKQWWKAQGPSYQQDYKEYLAVKPVTFYTAFDYSLVGVKLSSNAQKWMQWVSDKQIEMDKHKQNDPTYSLSSGYDQINAYVRDKLGKKDKSFQAAIDAQNTPGWGIDNILGYGLNKKGDVVSQAGASVDRSIYDSKGDYLWAQFLKVTREVTDQLRAGGYSGVNYGTDSERQAYRSVQEQVGKIAQGYKREDPQFKEMWETLQQQYGDTLMQNLFIPDDLFPPIGAPKNG